MSIKTAPYKSTEHQQTVNKIYFVVFNCFFVDSVLTIC